MRRLVFFGDRVLNESRERVFRLDDLAAMGLPVEFWDLTSLNRHRVRDASELARPYVRRFGSWPAVEEALRAPEVAESVFVVALLDDPRLFGVWRLLSRCRAQLAVPLVGAMPANSPESRRKGLERLAAIGRPGLLRDFILSRWMNVMRRLGCIRGFDLAMSAGDVSRRAAAELPVVAIHHCDYDDWRENLGKDRRLVEGRFAVFLDTCYTAHPDHVSDGLPPVDANRYFGSLNEFFGRLERRHGLEIVVAAHPKADYRLNPFEGRKVFKSSTRSLTRDCEFALTHFSTAISYPILDRKPIFFMDSEEMAFVHRRVGVDKVPRMYAEVLGGRYVNWDHPAPEDEVIPSISPAVYEDYKYRYLVSRENEALHTREILARFLRGTER